MGIGLGFGNITGFEKIIKNMEVFIRSTYCLKCFCPVFLLLNAFKKLFGFFRIVPKIGSMA